MPSVTLRIVLTTSMPGVVSAVFLVREMVSDIVWQDPARPLHLRVTDTGERGVFRRSDGAGALLYDSGPPRDSVDSFNDALLLEVGERLWHLEFSAPKHYFLATADRIMTSLVHTA